MRTSEGSIASIIVSSGVEQGCPLSTVAFNRALGPVLKAAKGTGAGYTPHSRHHNIPMYVLAYADNLALISDTSEGTELLLQAVGGAARGIGLKF